MTRRPLALGRFRIHAFDLGRFSISRRVMFYRGYGPLLGPVTLPPGPDRAEDPAGAFRQVSDAVQAGLDDPAVAGKGFDGPMGPQTFEGAVGQFLCGDLVVHQWDLARATGQDETLDLDEVRGMHAALLPMDDFIRSPGIFGPKIDPPAGADEQTALLCFLGRQV